MTGYTFSFGIIHYTGNRDGTPFTLADCLANVRGVRSAAIYRDGKLIVKDAGNGYGDLVHEPSGVTVRRQKWSPELSYYAVRPSVTASRNGRPASRMAHA